MARFLASAGALACMAFAVLASPASAAPPEDVFKARCAGCHEPHIERAPGRADIALMSPGQIVGALEGVMAPMATGLSKDDIQQLAAYLSAPPAPSANPTPITAPAPGPLDPAAKPVEWAAYGGAYNAQRYSALDQINKSNVSKLRIAWRQSATPDDVRNAGRNIPPPPPNNETTPLMAGGLVYYSTGIGGVAALDPLTGKVVWHVDNPPVEEARSADDGRAIGNATRSVIYSSADGGRVYALVAGRYLMALDAKTGQRLPDFGTDGQVDLRKGQERGNTFSWRTGPTLIIRGVIIIGSQIADINSARSASKVTMPLGDVRGIDAKTGKQLWIWHAIPKPGEVGNETWLEKSWEYSGNTNVWGAMSGDEELGMVYLPETTPTNDWYGGKRPGANLFAESIVALDARTGKRVWHFQGVHHGLWDYDFPCAPVLVDINVKGKAIKALAQPSKQSMLYVLDSKTGKPIWPIVERPVPKGDAPGEWYSPTQPIPLDAHGKPFAYDQLGVSKNDLIDFTPELRAEAEKLLEQYAYGPVYFPIVVKDQGIGAGKKGSLHMPGSYGGTNWPGAGFDPETGILYVPSAHTPVVASLVPAPAGSDTGWVRDKYEWPAGPQGLPLFKPPYGRLVAIDLNKGEIKWTVANGDGPRDHPALKGLNLPQLGVPGRVGPLVTKTLVFMGEGLPQDPPGSGGKKFRAYDKATGAIVWETDLGVAVTGAPMTYAWQGRQYIIVPVGYPGHPGEFIALTLDQ